MNDLQTILQNLPKEINNAILLDRSQEGSESDMLKKLEKMIEELNEKNQERQRLMDRERRVLERKIDSLKPIPKDSTLREVLSLKFPYSPRSKFPAFIWQVDAADDIVSRRRKGKVGREEDVALTKSWKDINPGFVNELVNEEFMDLLVRFHYQAVPEVMEAYQSLPATILKVDFFKYLILLARGGIYCDIDTTPIQAIPNWVPEDMDPRDIGLVIGIEFDKSLHDNNNKVEEEMTKWENNYMRRLQFGTWVIQTKMGHPILRDIVVQITEMTLKRKKENKLKINLDDDLNVMGWTGSGIWTDTIFAYLNDPLKSGVPNKVSWKNFRYLKEPKKVGDVLVFPEISFNAPETILKKPLQKENLGYLVTHKAEKFWKSGK